MAKKILVVILLLGAFVRFYRLEHLMMFIGDQGWFYIQARDLILSGQVPLVGIASSHVWVHQGPYWTYILASIMNLFGFNPIFGAYVSIFLGVVTIWLVYFVGSRMFSERVGLISAVIFSFSPLVIIHSRMSYHTSPIPLFSTVLVYAVFRWVNGNVKSFPIVIFLLTVLYNFELATFVFVPVVFVIFLYGFLHKKPWVMRIFSKKILATSLAAFLIPMLPMIISDISSGYNQTIKFGIWVIYRIAVFLGYPPLHPGSLSETWTTFIPFSLTLLQRFTFLESIAVSVVLPVMVISILLYKVKTESRKKLKVAYTILFLSILIPLLGYIAAKTNSEPYVLILFPSLAITFGVTFDFLMNKKHLRIPVMGAIALLVFFNIYYLISNDYLMGRKGYGIVYSERRDTAKRVIREARGESYSLIGRGKGSQHESFLSNYDYLTWWLGHPPSKSNEKLRFYVVEHIDRIYIERE